MRGAHFLAFWNLGIFKISSNILINSSLWPNIDTKMDQELMNVCNIVLLLILVSEPLKLFLLELLLRTQASEAEVDLKIQCLEEGYIEEALQFSSEEAFIHSACSDPRS